MQRAWSTLLVAMMACLGCGRPASAEVRPERAAASLALDELDFTRFRGASAVLRLQAHRLRVFPRQFGPFRVGSLQEAVLAGVRCEVLAPGGPRAPGSPLFGSDAEGFGLVGTAQHVAAVSIHGLECSILRGGEPVARVTAARAELTGASGELALRQLVLQRLPAGPLLRAELGTWNPETNGILIRGPYELSDEAGVRRGNGLRADVELRLTEPARR